MSLRLLSIVAVAAQLLAVVPVVKAQSTTAQCLSAFDWMDNSRNQNPCLVAAYVQGACSGGEFTVAPLAPDTHYTGPNAQQADPCQCSTVAYSLVSACGVCQNRTIVTWSTWATNCTSGVYVAKYPDNVPIGTAIPNWAFLDVTTADTFSAIAAQQDGDTPEATASSSLATGTVSNSASSTATGLGTAAPSAGGTATPSAGGSTGSSKKSNAGAIAGGVVGGVVGLALIAGALAFFLIRRRRANKTAPSSAYGSPYGQGPPSEAPLNSPPPMQQFHQPPYGQAPYNGSNQYVGSGSQPQPLYNPDDPSTWPQDNRVGTPTIHTTASGPGPHPYNQAQPGHYSGVPEL